MTDDLENKEGNQKIRMTCIDMATRIVGKPIFIEEEGILVEKHKDVIKVAKGIYEFVIEK